MSTSAPDTILQSGEGPAAEVINPGGQSAICLVCEHASPFIPAALADLGVVPEQRLSHAAWDIGGRDLAVALSKSLDAPLVVSRVSRLVYDCNRPPSAPDAIPSRSEVIEVPGNANLSETQKTARVRDVYIPFRDLLHETLDGFDTPPTLITIHSFTPVWYGQIRDVELGLLHDADDRVAKAMLAAAPDDIDTRLNAPYSVTDGVTHTLREHGISRAAPNVMIEVRNDRIADTTGIVRIAGILTDMVNQAMATQAAT